MDMIVSTATKGNNMEIKKIAQTFRITIPDGLINKPDLKFMDTYVTDNLVQDIKFMKCVLNVERASDNMNDIIITVEKKCKIDKVMKKIKKHINE